jgi:hypothetical protein
VARREYHDWLFAANPTLAHFSLPHILRDGATLLVSADIAVLMGAFVAGWFVIKPVVRRTRIQEGVRTIVPALIFFFATLGMIAAAYLSGAMPIIFPRYGLILFTLGIPILAWTTLTLRKRRPQLARRLLISVIAILAFDASVQLVGSVGLLNQISAQRTVADYLRAHFQTASNTTIFCDEGTVEALSGIPPEKFLTSFDAPRDREALLNYLKEKNVEYLIFVRNQDSILLRLFPELEYGEGYGVFQPSMRARTGFLPTDIWVYRVQTEGP